MKIGCVSEGLSYKKGRNREDKYSIEVKMKRGIRLGMAII
jgi:hypothetical protein